MAVRLPQPCGCMQTKAEHVCAHANSKSDHHNCDGREQGVEVRHRRQAPVGCLLDCCWCMQIQVQPKAEDLADQGQLDPAAPRFQGFVYSFNTTSGRGAVRQAPELLLMSWEPSPC